MLHQCFGFPLGIFHKAFHPSWTAKINHSLFLQTSNLRKKRKQIIQNWKKNNKRIILTSFYCDVREDWGSEMTLTFRDEGQRAAEDSESGQTFFGSII